MAFVSVLIGGIGGFTTFLCALLFFDVSLLAAFGLYVLAGSSIAIFLIFALLFARYVDSLPRPRETMLVQRTPIRVAEHTRRR